MCVLVESMSIIPLERRWKRHLEIYIVRHGGEGLTLETSA